MHLCTRNIKPAYRRGGNVAKLSPGSIYLEYLKCYFTSLWLSSHLHSGGNRSVSDLLEAGGGWRE